MARNKGSFKFNGGFDIDSPQPIDARLVVSSVSDLTASATWSGVGLYNGMTVAITETGELWMLIDADSYSSAASWKKASSNSEYETKIDILISGDTGKSVRTIAKEEVALIVSGAPEALDTIKEIADWIQDDKSGATKMLKDIIALSASTVAFSGATDTKIKQLSAATKSFSGSVITRLQNIEDKTAALLVTKGSPQLHISAYTVMEAGAKVIGELDIEPTDGEPSISLISQYTPTGNDELQIYGDGSGANILLGRDPELPLEAATKQYVDSFSGGTAEFESRLTTVENKLKNLIGVVPESGKIVILTEDNWTITFSADNE